MTEPLQLITANDLRTGRVVYFTAESGWTADLAGAELLEDEAHAALRLIEASAQGTRVVGPYLIPVMRGPQGPEPLSLRERIRATGPTTGHSTPQAGAHV